MGRNPLRSPLAYAAALPVVWRGVLGLAPAQGGAMALMSVRAVLVIVCAKHVLAEISAALSYLSGKTELFIC